MLKVVMLFCSLATPGECLPEVTLYTAMKPQECFMSLPQTAAKYQAEELGGNEDWALQRFSCAPADTKVGSR